MHALDLPQSGQTVPLFVPPEDSSLADHRPIVVVPCYNEARRLDPDGFLKFLRHKGVRMLFVDDGSKDETPRILESLSKNMSGRARVLTLKTNRGKAEAVRQGMLAALADGADLVGYYDADLATPPDEMCRLLKVLAKSSAQAALASRVGLLGTEIMRSATRHYFGRVFATAASMILDLRVYDTQCGAKAFRRSEALHAALAEPFAGRWAFDVELLGRMLAFRSGTGRVTASDLVEMPLKAWTDVGGSKLTLSDWPAVAVELARIARSLSRWKKA
jgi:glycosyltransferase involved in cell wall biosynthesis